MLEDGLDILEGVLVKRLGLVVPVLNEVVNFLPQVMKKHGSRIDMFKKVSLSGLLVLLKLHVPLGIVHVDKGVQVIKSSHLAKSLLDVLDVDFISL